MTEMKSNQFHPSSLSLALRLSHFPLRAHHPLLNDRAQPILIPRSPLLHLLRCGAAAVPGCKPFLFHITCKGRATNWICQQSSQCWAVTITHLQPASIYSSTKQITMLWVAASKVRSEIFIRDETHVHPLPLPLSVSGSSSEISANPTIRHYIFRGSRPQSAKRSRPGGEDGSKYIQSGRYSWPK